MLHVARRCDPHQLGCRRLGERRYQPGCERRRGARVADPAGDRDRHGQYAGHQIRNFGAQTHDGRRAVRRDGAGDGRRLHEADIHTHGDQDFDRAERGRALYDRPRIGHQHGYRDQQHHAVVGHPRFVGEAPCQERQVPYAGPHEHAAGLQRYFCGQLHGGRYAVGRQQYVMLCTPTSFRLRIADKLKAAGITPFAAGYATEWTIGQFLGYGASSILTPAAVELGDDYKKGNWSFDQPGIDQAFNVLDMVGDNTQDRPFDTDVSGQYATFAKGDAAMMLQGNWSILQIRELNPDIRMGMFPLPISDDPEELLFPKQYGFVINILKTSDEDPNKAEAINQFMEYFLNPENGGGYYYDEIGVPTANAFAEPKLDEASEILQQYLEKEKTVFTYYAYEPAGFDAESWKVTVEYLNSGNKDHKKLIQNFNDAFDKYADALE